MSFCPSLIQEAFLLENLQFKTISDSVNLPLPGNIVKFLCERGRVWRACVGDPGLSEVSGPSLPCSR